MYYAGLGPFTKQPVRVAKGLRDRKAQRALMQFFKPENYYAVREALLEAGRARRSHGAGRHGSCRNNRAYPVPHPDAEDRT